MPTFMDRHAAPGLTLSEALAAHDMDLAVQTTHNCRSLTFWLDESRGYLNCLVSAPAMDDVLAMHKASHGQMPHEIMEVHPDLVMAFLGRLDDLHSDTTKAPVDSSFRTVMFTDLQGSTAMTTRLGDARAMELLREHDTIVRAALAQNRGREVKHTGDGFMASFAVAGDAVAAAVAIQNGFAAYNARSPETELHVRIGLCGGEPVAENNDLFGTVVQLAARLCDRAGADETLAQWDLRELCPEVQSRFIERGEFQLKGFDRPVRACAITADRS
jgi:class 3 adenylate cyclase